MYGFYIRAVEGYGSQKARQAAITPHLGRDDELQFRLMQKGAKGVCND
jgi:hypothetical protein